MTASTPMIRQYRELKAQVPDCLLLFRLGDFYELFFEDAKIAARICDLTLTARHKHSPEPIPMCGVPYHSVSGYVAKMGSSGYKVAICEQTQDANEAKGLVRREVVRIVTPGMPFDPLEVSCDQAHYLAACFCVSNRWSVACLDVTNGEFWYAFPNGIKSVVSLLRAQSVKEVLLPASGMDELKASAELLAREGCQFQWCEGSFFDSSEAQLRLKQQFGVEQLDAFFGVGHERGMAACGALLKYLQLCEPGNRFSHIKQCRFVSLEQRLQLDHSVVQSLELLASPMARDQKQGLVQIIDASQTPMGRRLLRHRIVFPLLDKKQIERRLEMQRTFVAGVSDVRPIVEGLSGVGDLERLYSKVCLGRANPKEVWRLGCGLKSAQNVIRDLSNIEDVSQYAKPLSVIDEIVSGVLDTLVDDPPLNLRDGGAIRECIDASLKEVMVASEMFAKWRQEYEAKLQSELGIPSLKIKFNRVFGYGIEVTKPHLHKVPPSFVRKQTMVNGERFVTEALRHEEAKRNAAKDRQIEIEERLFGTLLQSLATKQHELTVFFHMLAEIDMVSGLSNVIVRQGWCCPTVDDGVDIRIQSGFHPVVYEMLRREGRHYVKNDVDMDGKRRPLWLVSGPNMGGKSTLMRQVAVTVILAQAGCFVPAQCAHVGIVDQLFTRIGTADIQTEGKSTFLLEMMDTARFLTHARPGSLILIDELGRGTSTFDGLSIVWSVCEFIAKRLQCRTICATHFYELAKLKEQQPKIALWHMGAKEEEGRVFFDYTLHKDFSSKSYGIHVARLAGVLPEVVARASEILGHFENREEDSSQLELPMDNG